MDAHLIHPKNSPALQVSNDTSTRSDPKVHPILKYLRDFVKKVLPKVDVNGRAHLQKAGAEPEKKGACKVPEKEYISPGLLPKILPNNPH